MISNQCPVTTTSDAAAIFIAHFSAAKSCFKKGEEKWEGRKKGKGKKKGTDIHIKFPAGIDNLRKCGCNQSSDMVVPFSHSSLVSRHLTSIM